MRRAISIHIGVNLPERPKEGQKLLRHSEDAAWRMAVLASQAGYESLHVLRGRAATRFALHNALAYAAGELMTDDNLLITFSGHGGRVRDVGDGEPLDHSWCLFDGEISDDKLAGYWRVFDPGVRIVVVSDSCFSGGLYRTWEECMARIPMTAIPPRLRDGSGVPANGGAASDRAIAPQGDGVRYRDAGGLVDAPTPAAGRMRGGDPLAQVGAAPATGEPAETKPNCITGAPKDARAIRAHGLLLAAAGGAETAHDGLFTCELLRLWNGGAFNGSYCELYEAVKQAVLKENPGQCPEIRLMGAATPAFATEPAFHLAQTRGMAVQGEDNVRYRGEEEEGDDERMRGMTLSHLP